MKKIIKYIKIFIITLTILIILLILSSTIPRKYLFKKVKQSSKILVTENNKYLLKPFYKKYPIIFDNFSDTLMINISYSINNKNPIKSAFITVKNYNPKFKQKIIKDSVGEVKSSSKYEYHDEVSELKDYVNDKKLECIEYLKYWHGYLIILRPLLIIFNVKQIRFLLNIILIILLAINTFLLTKRINLPTAIAFILSLISIDYFYIGNSLHNTPIIIIGMISNIIILLNKKNNINYIFFIIGIISNFFDLLTIPLIALYLPLLTYILLIEQENKSSKDKIKIIIKLSIIWFIGYTFTWITKWIISDLFFNKDIIITSIKQVKYRITGQKITSIDSIAYNIKYLNLKTHVIIINIILNIIRVFLPNKKEIKKDINNNEMIIYYLTALIPIIWYGIIPSHSRIHYFFTYRLLYITIFSFNIIIVKCFDILIANKKTS